MTFDFKYLGKALAAMWVAVQMGLTVGACGVHSPFEKLSHKMKIMPVHLDNERQA